MPWDSYASPALQAKLTTGEAIMTRIRTSESYYEQHVSRSHNMLFCRCFLEGGGSTDSFFVREDLQVDSVKK